jgi:cysteine desulfurase / selenocysteine lyase
MQATINSTLIKNHQLIRQQFPILEREMNMKPLVFLDSAASSQKPELVINAITQYYRLQHANIHRGVYQLSQEATDSFEMARKKVAAFINSKHEHEVIFTRGTTESINLVASSFGRKFFRAGDEILLSAMEHHSNIVPWQLVAEETGAKIKVIPIDTNGELDLQAFEGLLTERVKFLAITHVSNTLGTINPVKYLIDKAHALGIPVLLDGAQAAPHAVIDVQDLNVDFYAFSGHKMYGPTGIGVLYGKETLLNQMPPYHGGGEMIKSVSFEKTTYNDLPFKFEAGTPHISGGIGLGVAVDFIQGIGLDTIASHEQALHDYAMEKLSEIDGIRFFGTAAEKAGVISFLIGDIHPYDVGAILDKMGVAVRTGHHCTEPLMNLLGIPGTVRASFAVYNNMEDVDRLMEGIHKAVKMLS